MYTLTLASTTSYIIRICICMYLDEMLNYNLPVVTRCSTQPTLAETEHIMSTATCLHVTIFANLDTLYRTAHLARWRDPDTPLGCCGCSYRHGSTATSRCQRHWFDAGHSTGERVSGPYRTLTYLYHLPIYNLWPNCPSSCDNEQ